MSGGSHDYAYRHVEEMADALCQADETPLRRAFAEHLRLVAQAMHDVEWVDSCDYGRTGDENAIRKVLGAGARWAELVFAQADALRAAEALVLALRKADR